MPQWIVSAMIPRPQNTSLLLYYSSSHGTLTFSIPGATTPTFPIPKCKNDPRAQSVSLVKLSELEIQISKCLRFHGQIRLRLWFCIPLEMAFVKIVTIFPLSNAHLQLDRLTFYCTTWTHKTHITRPIFSAQIFKPISRQMLK